MNTLVEQLKKKTLPYRVSCRRFLNSVLSGKKGAYLSHLPLMRYGDLFQHTFFGYYDISPFNQDETRLLATRVPANNNTSPANHELEVGYYDFGHEPARFIKVGSTTTWCWQQGCRLQWHAKNPNESIFYNRIVNGRYGCVTQNIHTGEIERSYGYPVYSLSADGRWGISLNFSRLQRLRPGYGYSNLADETEQQLSPKNDGLWIIDFETGDTRLLFSIDQIRQFEPRATMDGATHYFNHVQFNPTGTRFLFFHLWLKDGRRRSRLITCDRNGKNLYALINEDHVSHYNWASENEIIAFATHAETGRHYYWYTDHTTERKIVGEYDLKEDGHPSIHPADHKLILTDTYPDRLREQHLMLYNLETNQLSKISTFYSPLQYSGEVRCDLHPRFSPSGKKVCVDSSCEGTRSLYMLTLEHDLHSTKTE